MASNVTLKIDDELLRKARILTTEEGCSISALLAEQLNRAVGTRRVYQQARSRAKARLNKGFTLKSAQLKSRDELYER